MITARRVWWRLQFLLRCVPALLGVLAMAGAMLLPGVHAHEHEHDQKSHRCVCGAEHAHEDGATKCEDHDSAPAHDESTCPTCRLIAILGTVIGSGLASPRLTLIMAFGSLIAEGPSESVVSRHAATLRARGPPAA